MTVEIKVPSLGESVTEATVAQWLKSVGEWVDEDEPLVELETDKVAVEVNAPAAGVLKEILVKAEDTVEVDTVIGQIDETARASAGKPAAPAETEISEEPSAAAPAPSEEAPSAEAEILAPSVRKLVEEHGLDPARIAGTGKGGRITKADVLAVLEAREKPAAPAPTPEPAIRAPEAPPAPPAPAARPRPPRAEEPREERVKMTRLRQTIARRLKEAQNTAAMLTTFNEVDMTNVMALRRQYRDVFEKKHGVRLGFLSFFAKACVTALKEIPEVNAEIDGDEIVYKNFYDLGIAVGTEQGLVVPVVRDVDRKSFAGIEAEIADLGLRARNGKLKLDDLQGGTFTISNGGVYGSLLSTPILNPPQSGILGMHKIQERPMVVDGAVVPRPMMYLALSYDHRIVDGAEAVTFLVRVKECLEDPERLLLDL